MIKKIEKAREILGLPPLSSLNDIKRQYKNLSKKYHPDVEGDDTKMKQLNEAYEILMNYAQEYKFSFSEDEIKKQYPNEFYMNSFSI
jgi:DnaJ-class molecular chaperone